MGRLSSVDSRGATSSTHISIWAILKRCVENGVFFKKIDINDITPCKLGNILLLINSRQTKEAGRAF